MQPPARTRVQVTREGNGVTLVIPPPLPKTLTRLLILGSFVSAVAAPLVIGVMFAGAPPGFRWLSVAAFALVSLLGVLPFVGGLLRQYRIEREENSLTIVKKGLWGTRRRRFNWSLIRSVSASQRRGISSSGPSGENLPSFELRIEIEGSRPVRLLEGANEYELRWIAWTIRNESPAPEPAPRPRPVQVPREHPVQPPRSRATLEVTSDGIRILLPALGVFRPQKNGALIGALVLPVFSLGGMVALAVFRSHLQDLWMFGMVILGLFVGIGAGVVLTVINERSRTGIVEAGPERLRISSKGILGTRVCEWPSSRVRGLRGGFSGSTVNDEPQMDLLLTLEDNKEWSWFKGRDLNELRWVASEVWKALGREFSSSEATLEAAGAECQVCGAKMGQGGVFCARCRTPHHEECWRYTGQCSTYGCREIRFTKA